MCSQLAIKSWHRSVISIGNFEHIAKSFSFFPIVNFERVLVNFERVLVCWVALNVGMNWHSRKIS